MRCPHCNEEIPGVECPQCNAIVPAGGRYCLECGVLLMDSDEDVEFPDDFDDRVLCPDGTCTGIIVDGRCSECGKEPGSSDEAAEA